MPGQPDPALFPRTAWAAAVRQALREAPDARFGYGDPCGAPELRARSPTYLGRVRGVVAEPERVIVTAGRDAGADRSPAARWRRAACGGSRSRSPAARVMRGAAGDGRMELVPVPVDERGLDVGALARCDVDAVLVTPAHQYPTGVVLAPERARRRCARAGAAGCSRTTTTPSSATTARPSARCRGSTPST